MDVQLQAPKPRTKAGSLLGLAAGLALIASLLGFWWLSRQTPGEPAASSSGPRVGQPALDFVLQDQAGNTRRLSSLRGQVVLLNLWATWCPPCRAEMPELAALYLAHKDEGFVIVSVDDQESKETVSAFLKRTPLPYPIWLDPDSRVSRAYGVDFLPMSFLIDRRGVLRAMFPGQNSQAKLEAAIKPLLAEK
jgi:cytochrome c biogenesis protein CcmG/thiol:disulfide interchange protein DsbE